jgi:hypothetical protein
MRLVIEIIVPEGFTPEDLEAVADNALSHAAERLGIEYTPVCDVHLAELRLFNKDDKLAKIDWKSAKMDWRRLELRLRDVLYTWKVYEKTQAHAPTDNHPAVQALHKISDIIGHPAVQALHEISDIIGEETGRGFPLEDM